MQLRTLMLALLLGACRKPAQPPAPRPAPQRDVAIATADDVVPPTPVQDAGPPVHVAQIAMGEGFTCALLEDHTVRCWGVNNTGQLGDGTNTDHRMPLPVTDLTGVVQIALGQAHTCALKDDNTVMCWGSNASGQLGEGTTGEHDLPHLVMGLHDAVEIACGFQHTCARRTNGSVVCWGQNGQGQVGDGTHVDRNVPTNVRGLMSVARLALGNALSCAMGSDRVVRCWGFDDHGALFGTRSTHAVDAPAPIPDGRDVSAFDVGGGTVCVVGRGGGVRCAGAWPAPPASVPDLSAFAGAEELAVSGAWRPQFQQGVPSPPAYHVLVCARLHDGSVRCGGDGAHGQLGAGANGDRPSAAVQGVRGATQLVVGGESVQLEDAPGGSACVRLSDATVKCWGSNEQGQLGDGTLDPHASPVAVVF